MKKNNLKIAVVVSKFNTTITNSLLRCCVEELVKGGVENKNILIVWAPGAYELPLMAQVIARKKKVQAIICLGCIIKGQTSHDQHIASWVSHGLGLVSLQNHLPVMFGVLTPNNEKQAIKRSQKGPLNRGKEVAKAALETLIALKGIR